MSWYKMNPIDWNDGTDDLTLEQEAAYLRICHAIYITERPIRANGFVIAGLLRCGERKASRLLEELVAAGKLVVEDGLISNRRALEEVSSRSRVSGERAASGSRGGVASAKARAKALKDHETGQAIASEQPKQNRTDETRTEVIEPQAQQTNSGARSFSFRRLIDAASYRGPCHQSLALNVQPVRDFLAKGYDFDTDLLPVVVEKASPEISSWNYFIKIAVARVNERNAIPAKPEAAAVDWPGRVAVWRQSGTWAAAWGPKPGEIGCKVPPDLLRQAA